MAPSPKPSLSTPAFPRNAANQPAPSSSTSTSLRPPRPRTADRRLQSHLANQLVPEDDEHMTPAGVERLRSLERDYRSSRLLGGLDPSAMPPPSPSATTSTTSGKKGRRGTDIEFATEIGQGLLLEVRKMQVLLHQKEQQVNQLVSQKADLERDAEMMANQLRQREEVQDRLKEQTWDLELAKQDLSVNVTELQQNLNRAHIEQGRLTQQLSELQAEMDRMRDREEKQGAATETMKTRHEHDMGVVRRHAASLQREKLDMRKQIDALTSELAIARAQTRIVARDKKRLSGPPPPAAAPPLPSSDSSEPKDRSPAPANDDKPGSPKATTTRNQQLEVETLKSSLAHAHRMVSNLRSNLHKEKTEKFEFKKLLAESQETIEQMQNEMWVDQQSSQQQQQQQGAAAGRRQGAGGKRRKAARRGGTSVRMPSSTRSGEVSEQEGSAASAEESAQSGEDDDDDDDYRVPSGPPTPQQSLSTLADQLSAAMSSPPLSTRLSAALSSPPQQSLSSQLNAAMSSPPQQSLSSQLNAAMSSPPQQSLSSQLNAAMSSPPHHQSLADQLSQARVPSPRPEPVTISTQTEPCVWSDQQLHTDSAEPNTAAKTTAVSTATATPDERCIPVLEQNDQPAQYAIPVSTTLSTRALGATDSPAEPMQSEWTTMQLGANAGVSSLDQASGESCTVYTRKEYSQHSLTTHGEPQQTITLTSASTDSGIVTQHESVALDSMAEAPVECDTKFSQTLPKGGDARHAHETVHMQASDVAPHATASAIEHSTIRLATDTVAPTTLTEHPITTTSVASAIEPAPASTALARNMDAQTDSVHLHDGASQVFQASPSTPDLKVNANIHLQDIAPVTAASVPAIAPSPEMSVHSLPAVSLDPVVRDTRSAATSSPVAQPVLLSEHGISSSTAQPALLSEHSMPSQAGTGRGKRESLALSSQQTAWSSAHGDVHSAGQPVLSESKLSMSESEPFLTATQPVLSESKLSTSENGPFSSESKPLLSESKPLLSESKQSLSESKPPSEHAEPFLSESEQSLLESEPLLSENKPFLSESKPFLYENKPSLSEGKRSSEHAEPAAPPAAHVAEEREITASDDQHRPVFTTEKFAESAHPMPITSQPIVLSENTRTATSVEPSAAAVMDTVAEAKAQSSDQPKAPVQQRDTPTWSTASGSSVGVAPAAASSGIETDMQTAHEQATTVNATAGLSAHTVSVVAAEPSSTAASSLAQEPSDKAPLPSNTAAATETVAIDASTVHGTCSAVALEACDQKTTENIPCDTDKASLQSTHLVSMHSEPIAEDTQRDNLTTATMPFTQQQATSLTPEHVMATPSITVSSAAPEVATATQTSEVYDLSVGAQTPQHALPHEPQPTTTCPPGPPPMAHGSSENGHVNVITTQHGGEKLLTQSEADAMVAAALESYRRQSMRSISTMLSSTPGATGEQQQQQQQQQQQAENEYGVAYINTQTVTYGHRRESASSSTSTMASAASSSSHMMDMMGAVASSAPSSAIALITQTMIGDWMWKYTRKAMGGGLSERRHLRFFWIHPYTRTLYWSAHSPGADGRESKAKSAFIESVCTIVTPHQQDLPNVSLLIQTTGRPLQITAPDMACHDVWYEALMHLLARAETGDKSLDRQDIAASLSTSSLVSSKQPSLQRLRPMRSISSSITGASTRSTATLASRKNHRS